MKDSKLRSELSFIWLEITGTCQLECSHCYAESGPRGTHGEMSGSDWCRVIDDAASLGVQTVQFIGGEPTMDSTKHSPGRHLEIPRP
ncbi:MAG TPA: radical SAM protein [Pseudonocardiaceae bacterium]